MILIIIIIIIVVPVYHMATNSAVIQYLVKRSLYETFFHFMSQSSYD